LGLAAVISSGRQYGALCAATSSVSREALTQSKQGTNAWVCKVGLADSRVLNVEKSL
jgi:hypothetical protein